MKLVIASLLAGSAAAFAPAQQGGAARTSLDAMPERMWNKMVDKTQRSKAVPFLPRPINLDGSYVGDVGFDPFYLSSIPKNFAGFIQPPSWEAVEGLPTLYWMREAELKHGRVAMLAWTGWLATDGALGPVPLRFPGEVYQEVPNSFEAHNIMVAQGSLGFMLFAIGFIEFCMSSVLVEVAKGESDREAGDFKLDPLQFLKGKSTVDINNMKLKELQNGRAAMLAFSGVVTQAALGGTEFPYLVPYPNVAEFTW
jgi:light-harvesting complex I chlorophyll a/b binding protein 1